DATPLASDDRNRRTDSAHFGSSAPLGHSRETRQHIRRLQKFQLQSRLQGRIAMQIFIDDRPHVPGDVKLQRSRQPVAGKKDAARCLYLGQKLQAGGDILFRAGAMDWMVQVIERASYPGLIPSSIAL